MRELFRDLKYIEVAMRMTNEALNAKDLKLSKACILSIQEHLNYSHHPLAFWSARTIRGGCKN